MTVRAYGSSTIDPPTWVAQTSYELLCFVTPIIPNGYSYECTTPGTSGTNEPSWGTILGNTTVDGDEGQENPVVWTCRNLLVPNPLVVELDTEGFGGHPLKDIWVRNSGVAEFIVYGSHDSMNWRQIDELTVPHGDRDNRHKSLQNAYRYIRVLVDSENESEIEVVAGV